MLIQDAEPCSLVRGYGVSGERMWITWNRENIFWISAGLRSQHVAVSGSFIVLASAEGRVTFLQLSSEPPYEGLTERNVANCNEHCKHFEDYSPLIGYITPDEERSSRSSVDGVDGDAISGEDYRHEVLREEVD